MYPTDYHIHFTLSQYKGPRTLMQCPRTGTALGRGEYCKDKPQGERPKAVKAEKKTMRRHDAGLRWCSLRPMTQQSASQVSKRKKQHRKQIPRLTLQERVKQRNCNTQSKTDKGEQEWDRQVANKLGYTKFFRKMPILWEEVYTATPAMSWEINFLKRQATDSDELKVNYWIFCSGGS